MLTIGITGGTGSGKSHIAELFAQHGGETVDADVVYHKLLGICHGMKNDILALFPEAADVHGNINRRKLASIVFTNDKALTDLNAVTHGYIIDEVEQ
ncbi:MAG: dephospho-CoA kinase, partial [Clostridia bacterium]